MNPETIKLLNGMALWTGITLLGICLLLLYWKDIFKKKPFIEEGMIFGISLAGGYFFAIYAGISVGKGGDPINDISALAFSATVVLVSGAMIYLAGQRAGKKEAEKSK